MVMYLLYYVKYMIGGISAPGGDGIRTRLFLNFHFISVCQSQRNGCVGDVRRCLHRTDARRVRIEVKDHGEGIPPEAIPNIWDRYYKVDKTHRRAQTGSGLGLSIVKSILELHHARYGVESALGEGSTFWFEL